MLNRLRLPYQPPLLLWTFAFTAGAALALTDARTWVVALAAATVTLLSLASAARINEISTHKRVNLLLLLLTPTLLGLGFWRAETTTLQSDSIAFVDLAGQTVQLKGVVIEDPQFRNSGVRLLLQAEALSLGPEGRKLDDRIQVNIPDAHNLAFGDRITFDAVLSSTAKAETDYIQWLANRRIAATAEAQPGSLRRLEPANLPWWQDLAAKARSALNHDLRDALPPPLSGIAQGMITGRRDAIDPELRSDLNDTSLSHLIVISGSNLTLLTALVMAGSAWLIGRRGAALLAILAALAYGTLIGPDPPVQRAMWMAIIFATAHMLGRGASAFYAVSATAGLMVALEPHILLDLSFQLTLAGTMGIVLLMPALSQEFLSGERGMIGTIRDAALVTLVATLATMPLIVLHFERAALIGLPANLFVTPVFAWMFLGSAATAILGLGSDSLAAALGWPLAWLPLRWLTLVAQQGSQLPGAGVAIQGFGHAHLAIVYAAVLIVAFRPHRERVERWSRTPRDKPLRFLPIPVHRVGFEVVPGLRDHLTPMFVTGTLSALAAALWLSACSTGDEHLQVHFIDVGQGDSALIVTPERQSILIDTGEQPQAILGSLRRHLPTGVGQIDLVVITHPQSDHGEALWAILDHYDVGQVLVSPYTDVTHFGRRFLDLIARNEIPTITARPGTRLVLEGQTDLLLDVLWPPRSGLPDEYLSDPNSTSIVIRARYADASLLFAGDINATQELDLVRNSCAGSRDPCDLSADVLKVAHQGSRFSSSTLFLESVRPTFAILSAGTNNPHGHPHDEVLDSLHRIGVTSLVTSEHGDITIATNGQSLSLTTER